MLIFKSSVKKLLEEAEQKGYERGCLEGWKNCELNMAEVIKKVREISFNEGLTRNPFKKVLD
jgi:hypothetical protein